MNADDLLARIFGALKALIAQLHTSLVLTARPIGAVTLDTSGALRQLALHFDMTMDGRHKEKLPSIIKARKTPEGREGFCRKERTYRTCDAAFWVISLRVAIGRGRISTGRVTIAGLSAPAVMRV